MVEAAAVVVGEEEVLVHQQLRLVAEEEVAHFTAQVRRLLDDAVLRNRLGQEGREYARHWAADGPAQALVAFYEQIRAGRDAV